MDVQAAIRGDYRLDRADPSQWERPLRDHMRAVLVTADAALDVIHTFPNDDRSEWVGVLVALQQVMERVWDAGGYENDLAANVLDYAENALSSLIANPSQAPSEAASPGFMEKLAYTIAQM